MLDRGSNTPKNHAHLSDLINLSSDDSFGGGHGAVNTRTEIFGNNGLAASAADEEGGSGASTPPLWAGSGSPESRQTNYESLSPRSRTEAIVRGQMELMEMVKSMPESCYELSLKDLVEVNRNVSQERLLEGRQGHIGGQASHGGAQAQQQHRHHQMVRSGSLDGSSGGVSGSLEGKEEKGREDWEDKSGLAFIVRSWQRHQEQRGVGQPQRWKPERQQRQHQ